MTIRRSVDSLVAEGRLERRHGSGTYVVPRPFVRALALTSFSRDMRDRGLVPSSRLVSFTTEPADAVTAGQLGIAAGTRVVSFTRVRLGSGEPLAVETVWIAQSLAPFLAASDLTDSLYETLAARYGIVVESARVVIEPVLPDRGTRDLLGIEPEQACLRLRMTDVDRRGRVVMIASCVYRGDKYQLTADVAGAGLRSRTGGGVE